MTSILELLAGVTARRADGPAVVSSYVHNHLGMFVAAITLAIELLDLEGRGLALDIELVRRTPSGFALRWLGRRRRSASWRPA